MTMNHAINRLSVMCAALLLLGVAACGNDDPAAAPVGAGEQTSSADRANNATYSTEAFVLPFEVTVPAWLPGTAATVDDTNFVTWEPEERSDLAVRFLVPVNVFPPGGTDPMPTPADYVSYLLGHGEHGATLADLAETTVDGRAATLVTATVAESLDGSLGCPAEDVPAPDCFGLQPDLVLRIAVVHAGGSTLVAWLRQDGASDTADITRNIARFEDMLASIRFLDRGAGTSASITPAPATPIDGVWTTSITEDELSTSPLLLDADEVNDENWGDLTFTFEQGTFRLLQANPRATWSAAGEFRIDGSTIQLELDNGERFAMRWSVDGDELTLTRDEELGIAPTPFVMRPWTRQG